MHFLSVFLIGVALSFDTMAIAAVSGARQPRLTVSKAAKVAFVFGFFHLLMPLIGWVLGLGLERLISSLDHWIAFLLLGGIGAKMLYESTKPSEVRTDDITDTHTLLILAVACSIDALVVGMSFGFLPISIVPAVMIIGTTTFVLSFTSVYIGKKFGEAWSSKTEILGSFILIGIGLKILIDHLL